MVFDFESQIYHFLTPPHYTNYQNSIISIGYVDSQAKIFLILYHPTTHTTITLISIRNYILFFQLAEDTGLPKHQLVYLVGILEKKIDVNKGQAHHMFSRFLNLRIYEMFSQNLLCFVFLQGEKFSIEIKNPMYVIAEKDTLHPSEK